MGKIYDVVESFLRKDGWDAQQLDDDTVLRMQYEGENGEWTCYAQAEEADNQFIFYSVCPLRVPDGKEAVMAEFLTKANYGLRIGNFEMDYEEGTLRFKTSLDVEGDRLTPALVKNMIYANVQLMDHYTPGIMRLTFGDLTPTQAIASVESEDIP